jgi:DNA-directed RNA polymerase specialized sigma24 family protein
MRWRMAIPPPRTNCCRWFPAAQDEILAVHDVLDALTAEDATAAEVVKLRYFVGMTIPEIAEALEISPRSANRHWVFARAWLKGAIRRA